jgi:hypothetical protein
MNDESTGDDSDVTITNENQQTPTHNQATDRIPTTPKPKL